jgi:hypothetical protein
MDAKKKKHLALKDKRLSITQENTKLLKEIASLKERHLKLLEEIKDATSFNEKKAVNASRTMNTAPEKAKLLTVANDQEQEVELLKLEIQSLRTKRGKIAPIQLHRIFVYALLIFWTPSK